MEFIKVNIKNIIIGVLIVLVVVAGAVIICLVKKEKKDDVLSSVTGKVLVADATYVLIEDDNGEDYLVNNIKGVYNVGDEVKFYYYESDLSDEDSLKSIKIQDEDLIKVALHEEEQDEEIIDNTVEQNNTVKSSTNNNSSTSSNQTNTNSSNKSEANTSSSTSTKSETSSQSQNSSSSNTSSNDSTSTTSADRAVLGYFEDLESDFNATSIKDSVKSGFITVVDFLFYDGTIKGYSFSQLTSSAKLKVLKMGLYFDSKIEKYFPGYKESISNTTSKVYTNIKEKIVRAYLTLTTSICASNSELCSSAKEGFGELKTNFGLTWSLIKDIAGDGITNLKSWYEIWSGK